MFGLQKARAGRRDSLQGRRSESALLASTCCFCSMAVVDEKDDKKQGMRTEYRVSVIYVGN